MSAGLSLWVLKSEADGCFLCVRVVCGGVAGECVGGGAGGVFSEAGEGRWGEGVSE